MKYNFRNLSCQHLKSIGHKSPSQAVKKLNNLMKNNGQKFVLDYLSRINDAIRETLLTGSIKRPEGIAVKRYLLPCGERKIVMAEKWIESALQTALNVNLKDLPMDSPQAKKVLGTLNLKHVFSFKNVQEFHIEKFNNGVEHGSMSDGFPNDFIDLKIIRRKDVMNASKKPVHSPSIFSMRGNEKKSPTLPYSKYDKGKLSSVPSTDVKSRDLLPLMLWYSSLSSVNKRSLRPLLDNVLHYKSNMSDDFIKRSCTKMLKARHIPYDYTSLRGKISHLMESGGKDRAIAQPFFAFQVLFEPLKGILKNMTMSDPNIFTFSQDDGVTKAQSYLKDKKTLYCFDASSFTDRFPLDFQLKVLKTYGLTHWATALESFMEGGFYDPDQDRIIKYSQGQPMGLGPSFHLATLAHSTLVLSLYSYFYGKDANQFLKEEGYGVVGDDIFISNKKVALAYRDIMSHWDVEINMLKSVVSNRYGEFCGVIFTQDSKTVPFKPKRHRWQFDQIQSAVNYYGKGYLKLLSKSNKHTFTYLNTLYDEGGHVKKFNLQTHIKLLIARYEKLLNTISTFSMNSQLPDYQTLFDFNKKIFSLNQKQRFFASGHRKMRPTCFASRDLSHVQGCDNRIIDAYSKGSVLSVLTSITNLSNGIVTLESIEELLQEITCTEDLEYIIDELKNNVDSLHEVEDFLALFTPTIEKLENDSESLLRAVHSKAKHFQTLEQASELPLMVNSEQKTVTSKMKQTGPVTTFMDNPLK